MTRCCTCGNASYSSHFLIGHEYWCNRCLDERVKELEAKLAEVEAQLESHAVLLNEFAGHVKTAKRECDEARALLREACEIWDDGDFHEVMWDDWIERAKGVVG